MSDHVTQLDQVTAGTANITARLNEMHDALSPAAHGGRRQSNSTGLSWGSYGGDELIHGVPTFVSNQLKTLTTSVTNYLTKSRTGVISANTTIPPAEMLLYTIYMSGANPGAWEDNRTVKAQERLNYGIASVTVADGTPGATLTQAQALCDALACAGTLTATRNVIVPLVPRSWIVRNNCTGGSIQIIGASGTGTTIAAGKAAIVLCNGTNVDRITADAP